MNIPKYIITYKCRIVSESFLHLPFKIFMRGILYKYVTKRWLVLQLEALGPIETVKQELADGIGVSVQTVRSWTSGRKEPSENNRAAIVSFFKQKEDENKQVDN